MRTIVNSAMWCRDDRRLRGVSRLSASSSRCGRSKEGSGQRSLRERAMYKKGGGVLSRVTRRRCSRRRSAGGEGGTTLFRCSSDEDGGNQRTSQRAQRAIKHGAMGRLKKGLSCVDVRIVWVAP